MPQATVPPSDPRNQRKVQVGVVVSNKMAKTIVVRVNRLVRHRQYNRVIMQASRFKAHDETNSAHPGDVVRIMEIRPMSKDKRWRLVEIVRRASSAPPIPGTEEQEARPAHHTKEKTAEEAPAAGGGT